MLPPGEKGSEVGCFNNSVALLYFFSLARVLMAHNLKTCF